LRLARVIRSGTAEYLCLLAEADFALRDQDDPRALLSIQRAFTLGREHGILTVGWFRPKVIARLCARALEANIEIDYARRLVNVHHLVPDPAAHAPEAWPWPVRIYALGGFEVHVDDSPVLFAGKTQRKPLALLKAIVAFGAHGVSEQEVADTLWPDLDGDAARKALTVTLHRLRRLLRHDEAIRRQEGRLEVDQSRVWIDVLALEACFRQAGKATAQARSHLVDVVLRLYRGALFAGDEEEAWSIARRERLHFRVLRELLDLGGQLELTDPERAVGCYLKALEVDDCAEQVYQRLIIVYQGVGRQADAVAAYERCRARLSAAFAVAPSPETEALLGATRPRGLRPPISV
jgi:DNA-binding SARP family transcriptional activator